MQAHCFEPQRQSFAWARFFTPCIGRKQDGRHVLRRSARRVCGQSKSRSTKKLKRYLRTLCYLMSATPLQCRMQTAQVLSFTYICTPSLSIATTALNVPERLSNLVVPNADHAGSQVFNCTLWKNKAKQDSNVSPPPKSPPQQSTPTVSPPPSPPPPGSLILDSAVVLGGVCPKQWAHLAGFLDGELEDVGFALPCACIDVLD
jgi:hypothetical protein